MTIEKLNRLAELSSIVTLGRCLVQEEAEYRLLLNEWKKEQDNKFDIRCLKVGQRIRHKDTGYTFTVICVEGRESTAVIAMTVDNPEHWTNA